MKIFYLPQKGNEDPWTSDFIAAVGDRCPVVVYDETKPLAPQLGGVEYVVELGGKVATHEIIDAAKDAGVRFWQIMGTGMDHVDIRYFDQKRIPVSNTPGQFSAVALAEHAIYLMLCLVKRLADTRRCLSERSFYQPVGEDLDGKKLGLVGLGASGRALAQRAHGLGMRLAAIDVADIPQDVLRNLHIGWFGGTSQLGHLLEESDFVSIHVPLLESTDHLIDAKALDRMKSSAYLINVARGAIVDEEALLAALQSGKFAGAGLDVFSQEPLDLSHPFLHMDNVVVTQHIAGSSRSTSRGRAKAAAENVFRVADGLPPLHPVTTAEHT